MPEYKQKTPEERKKIIESAQKAVLEDCRKRKEEAESWGPRGPTPTDDHEHVPLEDVGSLLGRTKDIDAVRKIIQRSKAAKTPEERAKNARDLMELYGPLPTPPLPPPIPLLLPRPFIRSDAAYAAIPPSPTTSPSRPFSVTSPPLIPPEASPDATAR